jgi:hypothetical protein
MKTFYGDVFVEEKSRRKEVKDGVSLGLCYITLAHGKTIVYLLLIQLAEPIITVKQLKMVQFKLLA